MNPEQWRQVDRLFHAALGRDPKGRAAFLDEACGGDAELRREVESLLAADAKAESATAALPAQVAADMLAENQAGPVAGQIIGHYQILSQLGAGGMGEVYLAEDTRLGRKVAIKLLPAQFTQDRERVRRFEQEARAASALNHPNLITIHEIGEIADTHFMVTEYIQGQTLRQHMASARLSLASALDVALQVATALRAAHEAGIVHRDIKPENIMLRPDGLIKVLDFGLAKLTEQPAASVDSAVPTLGEVKTDSGMVLGTASYMSPEQARGLAVDARSDIFSLGVVLYEMIVGCAPFVGATTSDVIAAILMTEPARLSQYLSDAPGELERAVSKALRKDRAERYQTVEDLLVDLQNLRPELELAAKLEHSRQPRAGSESRAASRSGQTGDEKAQTDESDVTRTTSALEYLTSRIGQHKAASCALALALLAFVGVGSYLLAGHGEEQAIDSIAVLPFVNVNADPNTEYLSEGISDSLVNSLSQLSRLRVMPWSSVSRYRGRAVDPVEAGRELGVRVVLVGKVAQHGDSLSIQTELIDVAQVSQLWGGQYTPKLADVLAEQGRITREITEKLRLKLTGEEQKQLTKRYSENPEAFQLYLKGHYHSNKGGVENVKKAIAYYEQATAKDPDYALAYAELAHAYGWLAEPSVGLLSPAEAVSKAREALVRALELDDTLAEAHVIMAKYYEYVQRDWVGAEREFKRAIELNPNLVETHIEYGFYLSQSGRFDEAIGQLQQALEIDPLDLRANHFLAERFINARRYDQAIEQLRKTFALDPNYWPARKNLGWVYEEQGKYDEAIAEYEKVRSLAGDNPAILSNIGNAYARAGRRSEAQKVIAELKERSRRGYVSAYLLATIYARLGEKEQALAYLEQADRDRDLWLPWIKVAPWFENLHSDPRFTELVRRVGLTP